MRTIAVLCFVFVIAISSGVLSTMAKAQDAPNFFHSEDNERLESIEAELLNIQKDLVQLALILEKLNEENASFKAALAASRCECQCDCGKQKSAAVKPKIVMVSMPGCPACDQWWANEAGRYSSSGWAVERVSESPRRGRLYPYWRVCIGDNCTEIAWVPFNQLDGRVQAVVDAN